MPFHLTQGTFSFLPPLNDDQIRAQIQYAINNGWAINIEFTDDPHPRNFLWDMWGLPMFDLQDPAAVMYELNQCKEAYPHHYIRINAYDSSLGRQTTALSFIVNRPPSDPGMNVIRQEGPDRQIRYTIHSYATDNPPGSRL
ncbi:ribulose-1,5-bisphosphate carboxylase/oxygenase small subunit [Sulfobacillus acidophilus TPY]|uniref:Ribulose 1,5-bisphosphate carboxylase small subunit n=2 Tax=Sulfobacillus acidophilus TaxID=53633 RepID=G8TZ50_SULAD|nr:ribulose-1,5-bisphosphate carboxylase/oxygenase small subunit [Sulfobacillus acidophilus DSM 10332]AEJ38976.1 ribulose-1,5-bisphosphate carboxylase/oxygenase small subunit [Sulfobacillus acidophilus TPY]AEW06320.1 ribulose 1,5-bisphosphate carboxylase small subunit [Sulfobacillus acidophilus DSM 10332]